MSAYLTTERTTCPSPWRAELAKAEPGGGVGGICVNLSPKLKHRAKRTNGLAQSAPCGLNSAPKGLRSLSAAASAHGCPLGYVNL